MSTEQANEDATAHRADGSTAPVQPGQNAESPERSLRDELKTMLRTLHREVWLAQWREVPASLEGPPPNEDARLAREAITESIDMDYRAFVILVGAEFKKLGPTSTEQDFFAAIDRAKSRLKPLGTKLDLMTGWLLKVAKGSALLRDIPPSVFLSQQDALAVNLYGWGAVLPRLGVKAKKQGSKATRTKKRSRK